MFLRHVQHRLFSVMTRATPQLPEWESSWIFAPEPGRSLLVEHCLKVKACFPTSVTTPRLLSYLLFVRICGAYVRTQSRPPSSGTSPSSAQTISTVPSPATRSLRVLRLHVRVQARQQRFTQKPPAVPLKVGGSPKPGYGWFVTSAGPNRLQVTTG